MFQGRGRKIRRGGVRKKGHAFLGRAQAISRAKPEEGDVVLGSK